MKRFFILMTLAACGGGDDGGGGGPHLDAAAAGAARATKLNALTSTDITAECKYVTYMWPQKTFQCSGGTSTFGYATQSACVTSLTTNSMNIPDCQATVGDLEDCLTEEYALNNDAFCSQTTLPLACSRIASADCGGGSKS